MNEQQVAGYLCMDLRELRKLAQRGDIPCRRVGDTYLFRKGQVDHWVEERMHEFDPRRLAQIERGVSAHHGFEHEELLVPLIPSKGLAVPLEARTREKALRSLVDLAVAAEVVYDADELLGEIREREKLCPTALLPGVAIPHPRHPLPWDIVESFVVAGMTVSGIPFGAEDGSLTRIFFLVCCKDERTHLHVLARLARVLHQGDAVKELLAAQDEQQFRAILHRREDEVL
jgi:PTS system nitrogen regulatory IIA component